jgi:hypothetical protein
MSKASGRGSAGLQLLSLSSLVASAPSWLCPAVAQCVAPYLPRRGTEHDAGALRQGVPTGALTDRGMAKPPGDDSRRLRSQARLEGLEPPAY